MLLAFQVHIIIRMILYVGGGIPFLEIDADEPSPLENAQWSARYGTPREARVRQMLLELFCDFIRKPGYFECLQAAAAAYGRSNTNILRTL